MTGRFDSQNGCLSGAASPGGPSFKRIKLNSPAEDEDITDNDEIAEELDGDHCSICLQMLLDRTVIPECSHEFCFECIVTWTEQSRRCPLCTRTIGPYVIHRIRSNYDYQKYHLPPLRSSPPPIQPLRRTRASINRIPARERRWGRRERREQDVADELERAIDRRRWVYHNQLYAKHVGSNTFSRYRPFPTPAQFAASQDYMSRATIFIRRELRVWANLDVEFLTTFILSLMKAIDIRSESAIKLMAEFLDMDRPYSEGRPFPNAEHFAHELYSFLRSPYKSLSAYDVNVQYDEPKGAYRRANRDNETAPERVDINEAISPSDESRARHYSRDHLRLHNGGSHSWSKLNGQDTNDKLDQGSSGSPTSPPVTSNESGLSAVQNDVAANKSENARSIQLADDRPGGCVAATSGNFLEARSRTDLKGKQRASPRNDLITQVNDGHGHVRDGVDRDDSRSYGEVEGAQTSGNASAHSGRGMAAIRADDSCRRQLSNQSQSTMSNSRTRNPLLIAQAHLDSESGGKRKQLKQTGLATTEIEVVPPKLRRSSEDEGKGYSLQSRISNPNPPMAQTNEAATDSSNAWVNSEGRREPVKPGNEDFRAKLLQRLELERAAQAERGTPSNPTSAPGNFIQMNPSGPGDSGPANLEEKARARARLRMKLTLEKHLNAPSARLGDAGARASEEKPPKSTNREGILRTVLENRRRGG